MSYSLPIDNIEQITLKKKAGDFGRGTVWNANRTEITAGHLSLME